MSMPSGTIALPVEQAPPRDRLAALMALLVICVAVAGPATAQDCVDYHGFLHPLAWIAGGGTDVAVSGDFAYATSSSTMRVLDISDPSRPFWRGSAPITHWPRGVAVSGKVAYVVEQPYASLLHAVDVRDPDNPFVISTAPISGWCQAVVVADGLAFTLCQGLKIFDVTNPAAMILLDSVFNLYDANALAVNGDLVAVASSQFDDYGHLHLIDVANPADARLIRMLYLPGAAYAIALHGQYAYLGGRTYPPSLGQLFIVDISDPQQPFLAARMDLPAIPRAVSVKDDALYVIDDARQLTTYKISNPTNPERIGQMLLDGVGKKLVFAGNIGVAGAGGVRIVDAQTPSSPPIIGQAAGFGTAVDVDASNGLALVACGADGLFVADISRADEPAIKGAISRGSIDIVRAVPGAALAGDNDAAAGTGKLVAIDVSAAERPVVSGTVDVGGTMQGLAVADDLAYVVSSDERLRIIDISDRQLLRPLGVLDLGHGGGNICVNEGRAFIASASVGLRIVDVTDPMQPIGRGSVALPDCTARAVAVRGDYAFVVGSGIYTNLYVADIRDPDAPAIIASTKLQGNGRATVVAGDVLYVAAEAGGLILVDVSDPGEPTLIGVRAFSGPVTGVRDVGGRIAVAAGDSGLLLLPRQCEDAQPPVAAVTGFADNDFLRVTPNPFNPRTTISFSLAEPGHVAIDILDARGGRQAVVADEMLGAGEHHWEWNGTDQAGRRLPSGSYLCRLSAAGSVWTTKLLLLR
jgi:hypothetical protein